MSTKAYKDTTGDTAVQWASAKLDFEPILWYTTSEWCADERIRTTIKYRLKEERADGRSMEFEFELSELIGLLRVEAKKYPSSRFNYLNIVNDEGAWRASRFALINDMKIIAEERERLRHRIQEATKERPTQKKWSEDIIANFERMGDELRSVAICDTLIWLAKKPKGWWAFLELLECLQTRTVAVNS